MRQTLALLSSPEDLAACDMRLLVTPGMAAEGLQHPDIHEELEVCNLMVDWRLKLAGLRHSMMISGEPQ